MRRDRGPAPGPPASPPNLSNPFVLTSCSPGRPTRYAYFGNMRTNERGIPEFAGITKFDLQASCWGSRVVNLCSARLSFSMLGSTARFATAARILPNGPPLST